MKIRTDFVTNSSSSSFVTYSINSEELVHLLEELEEYAVDGGTHGTSPCSDISIGDSCVEMDLPAPFDVQYLDEQLGMGDGDDRKDIQIILDNMRSCRSDKIEKALMNFYRDVPGEKRDALRTILQSAVTKKQVYCGTRADYTDGKGCGSAPFGYHGESMIIYDQKLWLYLGHKDKEIVVPEGVTEIASEAFHKESRAYHVLAEGWYTSVFYVEHIRLPESLKVIGSKAFCKCPYLKHVEIPASAGLTEIAAQTFKECKSLEQITIPDGVQKIGKNAFENCGSLRTLTLPESVTVIESEAFLGCMHLEELIIKGTLTEIGKDAFKRCGALRKVPAIGSDCADTESAAPDVEETITFHPQQRDFGKISEYEALLCDAFRCAETPEEMQRFLLDLCSIPDLIEFSKRLSIAMLLLDGMRTQDITDLMGASSSTIAKINKILQNTTTGAFEAVYKRLSAKGTAFANLAEAFGYSNKYFQLDIKSDTLFCYPKMPWMPFFMDAVFCLKSAEEVKYLLYDLCLDAELKAMIQRMKVAQMMYDYHVQTDITRETGASASIIQQVSRSMRFLGTGGFSMILERLKKKTNE